MKIEEDDEDWSKDRFDHKDEEHIGDYLAEEEGGGRRWGHALGFENLVMQFASPGLIEGSNGCEEKRDPEDAAGNLTCCGGVACGVEGEAEDDDDEQREEEHSVDGVAGAPLEAEVFVEMVENVAQVDHAGFLVRSARVALAALR